MVVVELGEARRHLAAPRAGTGDDDKGLVGLDVAVDTVTLITHDQVHIRGVSLGVAMGEDPNIPSLQLVLEDKGCRLLVEPRDHNPQNIDPPCPEVIDQFQGIGVIGDAEIGPDLLSFDIPRIDTQKNVCLVFELPDETHLDVGVIPWQKTCGVVIIEELPSELEVQLVEAVDPLEDFRGLFFDILLIVKSSFLRHSAFPTLMFKSTCFADDCKAFTRNGKGGADINEAPGSIYEDVSPGLIL